jgi:hypothetical protein
VSSHPQCPLAQQQGGAAGNAQSLAAINLGIAVEKYNRHGRVAPTLQRQCTAIVGGEVRGELSAKAVVEPDHRVPRGKVAKVRINQGYRDPEITERMCDK